MKSKRKEIIGLNLFEENMTYIAKKLADELADMLVENSNQAGAINALRGQIKSMSNTMRPRIAIERELRKITEENDKLRGTIRVLEYDKIKQASVTKAMLQASQEENGK